MVKTFKSITTLNFKNDFTFSCNYSPELNSQLVFGIGNSDIINKTIDDTLLNYRFTFIIDDNNVLPVLYDNKRFEISKATNKTWLKDKNASNKETLFIDKHLIQLKIDNVDIIFEEIDKSEYNPEKLSDFYTKNNILYKKTIGKYKYTFNSYSLNITDYPITTLGISLDGNIIDIKIITNKVLKNKNNMLKLSISSNFQHINISNKLSDEYNYITSFIIKKNDIENEFLYIFQENLNEKSITDITINS